MPQLLGDNVLPESVQSRRRQLRERVMGIREPARNFRENRVPGPDIVGTAESTLTDLRDRVVTREGVLSRIRERRSSSSGSSSSGSSSGNSSNGSSNGGSNNRSSSDIMV